MEAPLTRTISADDSNDKVWRYFSHRLQSCLYNQWSEKVPRSCGVHEYPSEDASKSCLIGRLVSCSQILLVHFKSERLPHKPVSRQLLGSLLQHYISSDTEGDVGVSFHELLAYIAAC
jgi:hypothetical protein